MCSVTISIVSHGHWQLIRELIKSIQLSNDDKSKIKIILTLNINEEIDLSEFAGIDFNVIKNDKPRGFGENNNNAFRECDSDYFCIMNPDVLIPKDGILPVVNFLRANRQIKILSVKAYDQYGKLQDNARKYPTVFNMIRRKFFRHVDYEIKNQLVYPDWVAGFFILMRSEDYRELCGFDEKYFLYCEDVDICFRAKQRGWKVAMNADYSIVHMARRDSSRKVYYFKLHLMSLFRFWYVYYLSKIGVKRYMTCSSLSSIDDK